MTVSEILRENALYGRTSFISDIKDDVAFSVAWGAYTPTERDSVMSGVEKRMFLLFLAEALEQS